MDPITASLLAGSTFLSAYGTVTAGKAAKRAGELNAYNIETERELNKAQAAQIANARMEEYRSATSSNQAAFAAMGRDIGSDTSVRAFMEKQAETIGTDLRRAQRQTDIESIQAAQRAGAERSQGRDAYRASLLQATQTLASGAYKYQRAK